MSADNHDNAYHGSLKDTEDTLCDHRAADRSQYADGPTLSVAVNNITLDLESWSHDITEPIHPPVTDQTRPAYPLDSPSNPLLETSSNIDLVEPLKAEIAQLKSAAETKTQEPVVRSATLQGGLKIVSKFLHAAGSKRNLLDEATSKTRAFEGALLIVYQGDEASLSTLQNLIDGTDHKVVLDTEGGPVDFTFAQLKQSSLAEPQGGTAGLNNAERSRSDPEYHEVHGQHIFHDFDTNQTAQADDWDGS